MFIASAILAGPPCGKLQEVPGSVWSCWYIICWLPAADGRCHDKLEWPGSYILISSSQCVFLHLKMRPHSCVIVSKNLICYRDHFVHALVLFRWVFNYISFSEYQSFDGLVQDCSISSALAMEILQSCCKPSIVCFLKLDLSISIYSVAFLLWMKHITRIWQCNFWSILFLKLM